MKRVGVIAQQVAAKAPSFDIIIRNGTIFDGLRTPRFVSDMGIRDGKVAIIGRITKEAQCAREIDATGLHVCPGFVDLHTHYDAQLFWDPYLTSGGWHGVTSVIIGNCGFGYAPCKPENQVRYMKGLERNEAIPYEAQAAGMPWDWETYPEFLDSIDRTPLGVNIMAYIGLAPIMMYVMGVETAKKRPANRDEMDEMRKILREGMEAGACGFSCQRLGEGSVQRDFDGTPMVTDTMSKEDLLEFAIELGEIGQGFIQVTGPGMTLTENIAKASGRPVLYNVVTVNVDQHGTPQTNHLTILDWLEKANKEKGLRIFGQAITQDEGLVFTFEDWNLFDSSAPWRGVTIGNPAEREASMRDPKKRQALIDEFDQGKGPFGAQTTTKDNQLQGDQLVLVKAKKESLQKYKGQKLFDIAKDRNQHCIETLLDISLEDGLKTEWTTSSRGTPLSERTKIATGEFCIPGVSDGGAHTKFNASGGAYTTDFIARNVRAENMMSLEDAHWRLSSYPAKASGMMDRGHLAEGMPADLLIYDYEKLRILDEEVLYDQPANEWRRVRKPEGYHFIMVNGQITFENNKCTGMTPGRLLRHGKAD